MAKNIEIKARTNRHEFIRQILNEHQAEFVGTDHQIDQYYHVPHGRLKLRLGNIEKSLIYYDRPNTFEAKESNYSLYKSENLADIQLTLTQALGVLVTVDKQREIYFIKNAKIHLDTLEDLGTFVEIEIIDEVNKDDRFDSFEIQCQYYKDAFKIIDTDLIDRSYSDLILALGTSKS